MKNYRIDISHTCSEAGKIQYQLKTPYRNGTTHIYVEPIDFISKLAALVPIPWVNLTRYHGIFAPNHSKRKDVVESKDTIKQPNASREEMKSEIETKSSVPRARRLKRVFDLDVKLCAFCGGAVRIIECIEEQTIINKILSHLQLVPKSNQDSYLLIHAPPA